MIYPIKTSKINDNIYAIRTGISNFYVFNTGIELIAFDAGLAVLPASLGFKRLNLNPENVSHVFLTHSDYDHTGGLKLFKNAKIYLSKPEEQMINGTKPRLLFKYNKRIKDYILLTDRQKVHINNSDIQIIFSPGHTPGSSCYLINDKILVTGDTLRTSKSGKITPFLFFQNMNHNELKCSLENLKKEGFISKAELILTGHTGVYSCKQN